MWDEILERDPILAEMVRRLVTAYQPLRIYLFGSRARGEADADSDYDLLVVVAAADQPRYRRAVDAFNLLRGAGAGKDVLVLTRHEFDRQAEVVTSLPATVTREGHLLYAA